MKKGIVLGLVGGILVVMGAGIANADYTHNPRYHQREVRQDARIDHGVASGRLTPWETRALGREQARISHMEARMSYDGWLSPRERLRLEREQNRASRHIWRMKHNGYRW
jgi:hypothetical protein